MGTATRLPYVSVKLTPTGRAQTFLLVNQSPDTQPPVGSPVIVQTGSGSPSYGVVVRSIPALSPRRPLSPESPKRVVRTAREQDMLARMKQQHREREAHRICLPKIRERNLPMKLTKVEQLFDGSKLIFSFTADERVDFRELVRELASQFRMRIEMRQIGPRDEAKLLGGYGTCGRPLCCTSWMESFQPISIEMAKQQAAQLEPVAAVRPVWSTEVLSATRVA